MFGRNMTLLALQKPGAPNYFSILRPNTGESFFDMEVVFLLGAHHLCASLLLALDVTVKVAMPLCSVLAALLSGQEYAQ